MILAHEKVITEYFLSGSNSACKNWFVSQFTCLQPHFYIKFKRWKHNQ